MEFNRYFQIVINGNTWQYQNLYDERRKHEVIKLYKSNGQYVKDFLRFGDLVNYVKGKNEEERVEVKQDDRNRLQEAGRCESEIQKIIQKNFFKNFRELMNGMNSTEFAEKYGLNKSTVYNYCTGKRFPNAAALYNIAEKCGVTVDWLIGRV